MLDSYGWELLKTPVALSKVFARGSKGGIEKQGVAVMVGELISDKDRMSADGDIALA